MTYINNVLEYEKTRGWRIGELDQIYRYVLFDNPVGFDNPPESDYNPQGYCKYRNYEDKARVCAELRTLKEEFKGNYNIWNESTPEYWKAPDERTVKRLDSTILNETFYVTSNGSFYKNESCTKWAYSDEYYSITGVTEFNWVCEDNKIPYNLQVFRP